MDIIVIGAGIIGISTALWLKKSGAEVTVIDRLPPGEGTSYGNAGVFASCSVVPVTTPGLIQKGPGLLLDPDFPLFIRWPYLPKLLPWLIKYMAHANDKDTRRIADGLAILTDSSVDYHSALANGSDAEKFITPSDYGFVYPDRAAFEADHYIWDLRQRAGYRPELVEGAAVQDLEPMLANSQSCIALMHDHGYTHDPSGYVKALAQLAVDMGVKLVQADVQDFTLTDGHISEVITNQGNFKCDKAVLATGVWSRDLTKKLGLSVPMETERGYHLIFRNPSQQLNIPLMITSGKFVACRHGQDLRCAGVVEFGGLTADASAAPLALLEKKVNTCFPDMRYDKTEEWLGHRPAPSDSLPLIGEIGKTGVICAFGHHHIGLTAGPKTGKIVADILFSQTSNHDVSVFSPQRFQ